MIEGSLYNAPKNLLKDKVILVTGGGSGIGRQAGLTFTAFGAEVILLGKNSSNLNETYSLFEKNNPIPTARNTIRGTYRYGNIS